MQILVANGVLLIENRGVGRSSQLGWGDLSGGVERSIWKGGEV
jgi:hypothetical protein